MATSRCHCLHKLILLLDFSEYSGEISPNLLTIDIIFFASTSAKIKAILGSYFSIVNQQTNNGERTVKQQNRIVKSLILLTSREFVMPLPYQCYLSLGNGPSYYSIFGYGTYVYQSFFVFRSTEHELQFVSFYHVTIYSTSNINSSK